MIAIVFLLNNNGNIINSKHNKIGLELGLGKPEDLKKKIDPKYYKFKCWNYESNEDLLVKVLERK